MGLGMRTYVSKRTAGALAKLKDEVEWTKNVLARLENEHDLIKFLFSGARLAIHTAQSVVNINVSIVNGCVRVVIGIAQSRVVTTTTHILYVSLQNLLTGSYKAFCHVVQYLLHCLSKAVPIFTELFKKSQVKTIQMTQSCTTFAYRTTVGFKENYVVPAVSSVVFEYITPGFKATYHYTSRNVYRVARHQTKLLADAFPGSANFLREVIRVVAKIVVMSSKSIENISTVPQRIVRKAMHGPHLVR